MTATVHPPKAHNLAYHCVGGAVLFLNKVRHSIQGYATPRPFAASDIRKAVEYDLAVVAGWLRQLGEYAPEHASVIGKRVLELGPGPDLGTGLILLSRGARRYHAIDANNLLPLAPQELYEELFREIDVHGGSAEDLRAELRRAQEGQPDRLNYICQPDFDIACVQGNDVDLVFSQAAFEHFEDPGRVVAQLSQIVRPGAILIAEVDLKTHTRWIRDADPLNIYRYSDWLYRLARFTGIPNRLRPLEYERILEKNGWCNIKVVPRTIADPEYVADVRRALNRRFRDAATSQIHILSMLLCATKA